MAQTGRRVFGTILFIAALAATLYFLFLLFADAEDVSSPPGVGEIPDVALGIGVGLGIIALVLLLLMLTGRLTRDEEEVADAEAFFIPEEERQAQDEARRRDFDDSFRQPAPRPAPRPAPVAEQWHKQPPLTDLGDGLVTFDLKDVAVTTRAWGATEQRGDELVHPFHFPQNLATGVYVNDYIGIGGQRRLKLRTLLAGPPDLFSRARTAPRSARPAPAAAAAPAASGGTLRSIRSTTVERRATRRVSHDKLPSDDFMAQLERRHKAQSDASQVATLEEPAKKTAAASEAYYDYPGDIHDVIDVEGIGPVYAEKLKQIGIHTTARLCYEDADKVATAIGTQKRRVAQWQNMAQMMKVNGIGPQYAEVLARAGIEGIPELKKRGSQAIADQVNDYLAGLETNVLGQAVTPKRVEGWQKQAAPMRRVRQRIPEQ
ncbi:MAG: DUF4332 domain-containing protein [Thermoplasmatota archaeon]